MKGYRNLSLPSVERLIDAFYVCEKVKKNSGCVIFPCFKDSASVSRRYLKRVHFLSKMGYTSACNLSV